MPRVPRGSTGPRGVFGSTASITTSTTITPGQIRFNNSTNSRLDDEGSWGFRSRTNSGYIQFGPANTSHAHIYTDRSNFYFNKELSVNGKTVYHSGNLNAVRRSYPGAASVNHWGLGGWIEFVNTQAGVYWGSGVGKNWHIYPKGTSDMYIRSGHSTNVALALTCNNTTPRGYVYADHGNAVGFLNKDRHWRLRIQTNKNILKVTSYSPNLYFEKVEQKRGQETQETM